MGRPLRVLKVGPVALPAVIAGLMAVIVVTSVAAVVGARNGWPWLLERGLLVVASVWHGQFWRLTTYALLETGPLSLIFSCVVLYWFGGDLARLWGGRRFVVTFFVLAAASGAVTCIVGQAWNQAGMIAHAGAAPVLNGLLVAWGLLFPARAMRLYGVVRLSGRLLVPVVFGGTVLFALFQGLAGFVPHFAAQLLVLLWLGLVRPWRVERRRRRMALAAGGEAWSFGRWYERERRRRP